MNARGCRRQVQIGKAIEVAKSKSFQIVSGPWNECFDGIRMPSLWFEDGTIDFTGAGQDPKFDEQVERSIGLRRSKEKATLVLRNTS
jgi:hypothetical protein